MIIQNIEIWDGKEDTIPPSNLLLEIDWKAIKTTSPVELLTGNDQLSKTIIAYVCRHLKHIREKQLSKYGLNGVSLHFSVRLSDAIEYLVTKIPHLKNHVNGPFEIVGTIDMKDVADFNVLFKDKDTEELFYISAPYNKVINLYNLYDIYALKYVMWETDYRKYKTRNYLDIETRLKTWKNSLTVPDDFTVTDEDIIENMYFYRSLRNAL